MLAAKEIGEKKFKEFVEEKVKAEKPDIFSTIPKTNLQTFTKRSVKSQVKTKKGEVVELRNDAKFISRMLAIGESREVNMKNLMSYSLGKYPPPFATVNGELVKSPKCKLLHELVSRVQDPIVETAHTSGALLIDAMAMLQTMKYIPQTFGELAEKILQLIVNCAKGFDVARVDFVSDRYPAVSIKNLERNKRAVSGVTQIRIGGPNQKVPRQFKKFLSLGENKESLVEYIFKHLCTMRLEENLCDLSLYFSHGQKCHRFYVDERNASRVEDIPELNSDHEEADTRLLLHAKHASIAHQAITVRSPDTDVFILMLGHNTHKLVFIAGDSILQHVHGWELSNAKQRVSVKSFSGSTAEDMKDYLKPLIRKKPDTIILHVGTNDIKDDKKTAEVAAAGILNLGTQIKDNSPHTKVCISGITIRKDKAAIHNKIKNVNNILTRVCDKNKWTYIDNSNVDYTCLNRRGLHLNKKGSATLSKNYSNYLNNQK